MSAYDCNHGQTELRERHYSNSSVHYVEQCILCGAQVKAYKHDSNEVARAKLNGTIKPFDEDLRTSFFANALTEMRETREQDKEEWFAWYNEYLKSQEWMDKRIAVLRRDQHICQGCRKRNATEIHHLNYDHVGDELFFELVSLCGRCHKRVHENGRNAGIRATLPR